MKKYENKIILTSSFTFLLENLCAYEIIKLTNIVVIHFNFSGILCNCFNYSKSLILMSKDKFVSANSVILVYNQQLKTEKRVTL